MKKQNYSKIILIITVAVFAFCVLSGCSSKNAKRIENLRDQLDIIQDTLHTMYNDCDDAYDSDDLESAKEYIYSVREDIEDLEKIVENLSYDFRERDSDYDGRRSWFY